MLHEAIRQRPLAACAVAAVFIASLLGHSRRVQASTLVVTNCNDSGTGSLRNAATRAHSGDTVDMRRLRCTIDLTRGAVQIPQADLALVGPGADQLAITSRERSRVFLHAGTGTLRIAGLSIVDGAHRAQSAAGGCIRSSGNVSLQQARVHHCTADGVPPPDCEGTGSCSHAIGGAIAASGIVRMTDSTVSDSAVYSFDSYGGGIIADELRMFRSRLLRNSGDFSGGAQVLRFVALGSIIAGNASYYGGGGVYVGYIGGSAGSGSADVRDSTFTDNTTEEGDCTSLCAGEARVVDSTFSGNVAKWVQTAIAVQDGSIVNSTVVLNRELYPAGELGCDGAISAHTLYLESSIVARNACGSGAMDLADVGSLTGAHDLVGVSRVPLPAGTLRGDPLLEPLAFNGGVTPTHALRAGSPAIDRGSNPLALSYDQRGPGFPRVKGAATDIGAFER